MFYNEIKKYKMLNEFAEQNGIVIFGSESDLTIPLVELKQAFDIEQKMYNRSITGLSVTEAIPIYDECVTPLVPETVLIHIGDTDLNFFKENPQEFDQQYCELINHIKSKNKKCRIAIVSIRNYQKDSLIDKLNKHLKYIADSENCEYGDIASPKVWNPKNTLNAVNFVYSIGFVHALKNKRPIYDLIKILFCCEA